MLLFCVSCAMFCCNVTNEDCVSFSQNWSFTGSLSTERCFVKSCRLYFKNPTKKFCIGDHWSYAQCLSSIIPIQLQFHAIYNVIMQEFGLNRNKCVIFHI